MFVVTVAKTVKSTDFCYCCFLASLVTQHTECFIRLNFLVLKLTMLI